MPFVNVKLVEGVFALQADQDSYDFAHQAQATVAPAWRNEVTMGSLDAILEHALGRFIDLVAPRPLLMILAKDGAIAPPDSIREAFTGAGGPKRLLEVEGGHYAVYSGNGAKTAGEAAAEWFTEHLLHATPAGTISTSVPLPPAGQGRDLGTVGHFAVAKIKEAVLAVTDA